MAPLQEIRSVLPAEAERTASTAGVSGRRKCLTLVVLIVAIAVARDAASCTCTDMGSTWLSTARYAPVVVLGEVESNDGLLMTFRVAKAIRGVVADRIEVTGDYCIPETHGIEVGSRLVMALQATHMPNLYSMESCRVTSLVAYGDRVYGRITGRQARQYSPDYVNESVPIVELAAILESRPDAPICTDDGDLILNAPTGHFIPARPKGEIVPALQRDCTNETGAVKVRVFVDDRGRVAKVRPLNELSTCV